MNHDMRDVINVIDLHQAPVEKICVISEFAALTLFMVARSHMWHLQTKSYSQHKALNEFYDDLQDEGDKFIEAAIGVTGPLKLTCQSYTFDGPENSINGINDYKQQAQELLDQLESGNHTGLIVTLEEIVGICDRTIYKITYLK